jgi:nicotinamide-nucleotide amidase
MNNARISKQGDVGVDKPLEVTVGELLLQHGLWLATAESCTGGLVSHLITNVAGSSSYYLGGVTAYSNEVKMRLLGVSRDTLEQHGAVSEATVLEMADGVRKAFSADIGISTSGIAGPTGGTPDKPVGTVWIGLSSVRAGASLVFHFEGSRLSIKEQAAQAAFEMLVDHIRRAFGP